jgi:hypothetical protein
MALLDRLRPQPAWKHSDPAVRASAVESLTDTDHAVLVSLATGDESPRVRRAAVARLDEVDVLAGLADRDADTQVRADAGARLLALACDAADDARALKAAAAVIDERLLAQIARTSPVAAVALATVDRLREPRSLATTARHAEHADVRLRALERVHEAGDLVAIAINTDHKDVGVAAVERISDLATLNEIADRARNKNVGKRARTIAREAEAREAEARAAAAALARRQNILREAVEGLERSRDAERVRAELGRLSGDWNDAGPADSETAARFAAAVDRVRAHVERLDQEAAVAEAERVAREAARQQRARLVEAVQQLDGADIEARIEELRAEWTALEPMAEPDQSTFARPFEAGLARAKDRLEAKARAEAMQGEIAAMIADATALAESGDLETDRSRFVDLQRRFKATTGQLALERAQYDAFHGAEQRWRAREEAARAAVARTVDEHRARLTELADRAAALAQQPEATIRDLDHLVRELRGALDQAPPLPAEVRESLPVRLKTLLGVLLPRLREQRETDDWRRWANAGIQEELVKRVEALRSVPDLLEAGKQLRDLRRQWKAVSAGPRDEGDALWQRFKRAADEVQAKSDEHYATIAVEQAGNLARRQAICDQAEALAQSTDWIATADTLKRLQGEWATVGPVPREQAGELARRFRIACDTFFTRRKTDLTERKHVWADNAQKKDALCARAEAVAESSEWAAAFNEIKQLQAEWKAVGPVRKNRSEALWKRFRAACDHFFERYGKRHELAHQQRLGDRESICQAVEALLPAPAASVTAPEADAAPPVAEAPAVQPEPPDGVLATFDGLWRRWHDAPGLPPDAFAPLRARFETAVASLLAAYPAAFKGSRFDLEAAAARRDALCREVENIGKETARGAAAGGSSAAALAALLKESLAANTIGGRVSDESRIRAAADRVRRAQGAWRDLGPMPGEAGRAFETRFQRACRRFFDEHPEVRQMHTPPQGGRRDQRPPRPDQRDQRPPRPRPPSQGPARQDGPPERLVKDS